MTLPLRPLWAWRELFQGQLWPVVAGLTLIVACVFTLSIFATRIEQVLTNEGRNMLAADLVLRTDASLDVGERESLEVIADEIAQQVRFSTMAFSDEAMQLVTVKAIDSAYPLRGEMILKGQNQEFASIQPGELWLSERLFPLLNVSIGDSVEIGDLSLVVMGEIITEPAMSFNPFNQMPLAMIHHDDIEATGVIRPGSRVSYRYFFNGEAKTLTALKTQLPETESRRWIDENAPNRTGDFLNRSRSYLSLTVILVILMSAMTLQFTCRHYVDSRRQILGMVKSLGASRAWILRWLATQLSLLFLFSISFGYLLGFGLEQLLRLPLTDVLPSPLPSFGLTPWLLAPSVAILVALPAIGLPLFRLMQLPALSLFQPTDTPSNQSRLMQTILVGTPALIFVAFTYQNLLLWLVMAGLIGILVLLAALGLVSLNLLKRFEFSPPIRLAFQRITRNPSRSGLQLGALSISLMLLAIIWLLRTDLLSDWQQTLPPDAPNVFAVNIAPDEREDYLEILDGEKLTRSEAYPIIRGRLVAKNGKRYADTAPTRFERDNALNRELNLTWGESLPTHNTVVAGQWPTEQGVSVEADLAKRLDISIGDTLTFQVNSQEFTATVNSMREVEWRNMRPNFYFIFHPETVAALPANWLVSFRLEDQQSSLLNQLARDYPSVSLLDLRSMGEKIQGVLQQIGLSLTALAALAVLAGLLLILTLLRISMSGRQEEIHLYRILGSTRSALRMTLWAEFGVIALVAALIAVIGTELAMGALVVWGLELPFRWHPFMWFGLPMMAMGLVLTTVGMSLRQLTKSNVKI